jgi:hypothetical protein
MNLSFKKYKDLYKKWDLPQKSYKEKDSRMLDDKIIKSISDYPTATR